MENVQANLLDMPIKSIKEKKDIFKALKEVNWVLDPAQAKLVQRNPLLLLASFNNDYDATIDALKAVGATTQFTLNEEEAITAFKVLKNHNFKLDSNNLSLVFNAPVFLLASLYNHYDETMELLAQSFPFRLDFDEVNSNMLYHILIDKGFVYSEKTPRALYLNKMALKASLENDYIGTMYEFDYDSSWSKEDKDMIYDLLLNQVPPLTYMSQKMLEDYHMLAKVVHNEELRTFVLQKIFTDDYVYTKEDEKTFLRLIGADYYNSIERYVSHIYATKEERYDLSFDELFAISFMAKKYVYYEGANDCKFNLFPSGGRPGTALGSFNQKEVYVYCNPEEHESILQIINTVLHEATHHVQYYYMKANDFRSDPDIDVYQKDNLLEVLSKTYYFDNYNKIFAEYDAETKSGIVTSKMLGLDVGKYMKYINKEVAKHKIHNNYIYTDLRSVGTLTFHLDTCLETKLAYYLSDGDFTEKMKTILKRYPLFAYDFKRENNVIIRRTMMDLIEYYKYTKDETYLYLLEQRLIAHKNKDAGKNLDRLAGIISNTSDVELQNKLLDCYQRASEINQDKLIKYRRFASSKARARV